MEQVFVGSSARVIFVGETVAVSKEGVDDGDNEGSAETSTDGSVEVEIDGCVEGWDEGAVVGSIEGEEEGSIEGEEEGSIEGEEEGSSSSLVPRKWRYKASIRSICPGVNWSIQELEK
jgi:hypothetical protein